MIDLKNWKTDIKITVPRFHWIRPKHKTLVAESLIEKYLGLSFWVSFIGWWQIYQWLNDLYQWVKPYYELIKPLLEKF